MIDVIRALMGPRFCPWCRRTASKATLYDRIYDRLPKRAVIALLPYDSWVNRAGGGTIHAWHKREAR